tara:strand:+ start:421 stop:1179 length:759 start_codon:yes stop_codon:yes gene_type:complete
MRLQPITLSSQEEMDSLKVGEEMETQQEQLLAGKYKSAEDLESAYIELQKKLGEPKEESSDETKETVSEETTEEPEKEESENKDSSILDTLWEQRDNKDGFSEEILKELASTNPGELAKEYLRYRQSNQPQSLTDENISQLMESAGGEEKYNQIVGWAKNNLSDQEQKMYDTVVDRGDPLACYFALQALMGRYNDSVGTDGRMLTGKPPSSAGDVFKSQAEMVKAMEDDRYNDDPAYRQAVMEKLERSNINF